VSNKKEKAYIKQITELTQENKSLRRRLRKFRKEAEKASLNVLDDFEDNPQEKQEEENPPFNTAIRKCNRCGGDIHRIRLLDKYVFDICQNCKDRERVRVK